MSPNIMQPATTSPVGINSVVEYMLDAGQRSILFWDVLRERGRQYQEHLAEAVGLGSAKTGKGRTAP